jgi:putative oxidoreductase
MFDALFKFDPFARFDPFSKDSVVALILRLTLAAIFLFHGVEKITGKGNDLGFAWAATYWNTQKEPAPEALQFMATQPAVAWGEVVGGAALLFGFMTRLTVIGMIIIQAGAIYLFTFAKGFSSMMGIGYEFNLAIIAMCVALLVMGSGALSVDRFLIMRWKMGAPKPTALQPG